MILLKTALAATSLVAIIGFGASAHANILYSEDFSTAVGGNYGGSPIPGTSLFVSAGNIDIVGTPSGSSFACVDNPGGNCLDLVGAFAQGGVETTPTFNLIAGDTYTVSFGSNLQGYGPADTAVTTFDVSVGDLVQTETLTAAEANHHFDVAFTPTADETGVELAFQSLTSPDAVHGAVIDNIVLTQTGTHVTPVPEPSALTLMLVGAGLIGSLRSRRRRCA